MKCMPARTAGLTIVLLLSILSCKNNLGKTAYQTVQGKTMGTTYTIKAHGIDGEQTRSRVDSILNAINRSVSTYIPNSTISVVNRDSLATTAYFDGEDSILVYVLPVDSHFMKNFSISKKYHNDSRGFFDPTVMPLVNYWGFGTTGKKPVARADSSEVAHLVGLTDYTKWLLTTDSSSMTIRKPVQSQLDFSAVAKGYAVDKLAAFLDDLPSAHYMIEIGGEVRTKGRNEKNEIWSIGLSRPVPQAAQLDFQAIIELEDMALASSGNYRNYYEVDGRIYGHEINPITGYPEINALLGVSVLATECAAADAMATAFMVMGLERSKSWLSDQSDMKAVLFYQDENGKIKYDSNPEIIMSFPN